MNDPDPFVFFEEPSPTAIEVPVLKVFDGDGFLTKIALCHLTDNPKDDTEVEAAIRLGGDAEALCPGLPWHNIRGIGNWLRHEYHRVDTTTIWNTVTEGLPPLKAAVMKALSAPDFNLPQQS